MRVVRSIVALSMSVPAALIAAASPGATSPAVAATNPAISASAPARGGYFSLLPPGATLPSESDCAARVHRSTWEPRPENAVANHSVPPATFRPVYGDLDDTSLWGRLTGNFAGTTDEIIQWAACKWGLSDEVIRAEAVSETSWYQNHKDANGAPINGQGYGDFGNCGAVPRYNYPNAPASYGLMQIKWCAHRTSGYGGWPWTEDSTAYNLDYYGALMRGCYNGLESWLGNGYRSGDMWGCIGRWYSGDWYSSGARSYISGVQSHLANKEWLAWSDRGTSDTAAPTVSLTTPAPNAILSGAVTVSTAARDDVGVVKVELLVDNVVRASAISSPWSLSWDTGSVGNGSHVLMARAYDAAGNVGTSSSVTVNVQNSTPPPGGSRHGLTATYYSNSDFTGAVVTRIDATVNFDWGAGAPDSRIGPDTFSSRWTGSVTAPTSEPYTLSVRSDDGVRLWLDGRLVIDDWSVHAARVDSVTVPLVAGRAYRIRLDYYENAGSATVRLRWATPSIARQVIPSSQLTADGTPAHAKSSARWFTSRRTTS